MTPKIVELSAKLLALLAADKLTVASAESCTGGLVGAALTAVPGASAVYLGGAIVYQDEIKSLVLGIDLASIKAHNAVSEFTAVAMATAVQKKLGATYGFSTTGVAGPGGGTSSLPVGTVFIAVSDGETNVCRKFLFEGDRQRVRELATEHALQLLIEQKSQLQRRSDA